MRALLMGYNDGVLAALDGIWPPSSVTVIEEADLWTGKKLAAKAEKHASFDAVHFGRYQQDQHFLGLLDRVGPVDVVAPGLEYAVIAAAEAADRYGLPGAGVSAARTLRDKIRLRERTTAAGMRGPAFRQVRSADEVAEFARGRACVVKPAERQASLGVVFLNPDGDPQAAWAECVHADEGNQLAHREMIWRYLVEERLCGPEFSIEALVWRGTVSFVNVTRKTVAPGARPVELGHVLPAPADDSDRWRNATQTLVDAIGFDTGLLHGEWIDTPDGLCLVECAGRPPGDKIMDLIDLAYGTCLTDQWLRMLAGQPPEHVPTPVGGAAVRFFPPTAGVLTRLDGVAEAQEMPGVVQVEIRRQPGDELAGLRSSWDRIGSIIAVGGDAHDADQRAVAAMSRINIHMD